MPQFLDTQKHNTGISKYSKTSVPFVSSFS